MTAQLVDARSGGQIWAERYEREAGGIFAVQDDVTQQIVVRLVTRIDALRKAPESWTAYDHYLRGNALMKQALTLDPAFAPALHGLAGTHLSAWLNPYLFTSLYLSDKENVAGDHRRQALLDRAAQLAQQAIDLDPTLAEAYATLGWVLHWYRGPAEAVQVFERAFELNPNLADGRFASSLSHSGRATEAIDFLKRVMRLDPFYPAVYNYFLGKAYFYTGRYEEAIGPVRAAAEALPGLRPVLPVHAAVAALSGREDEARAVAEKLLKMQPDFTSSALLRSMRLVRQEDNDRLTEGLRMAGLPE